MAFDFGHNETFYEGIVDGSGRMLIAGDLRLQTISGEGEALVVRLLADGTPDASFAIGGVVVENRPNHPRGIALDSHGRIVVGGDSPAGTGTIGNVSRLLTS